MCSGKYFICIMSGGEIIICEVGEIFWWVEGIKKIVQEFSN